MENKLKDGDFVELEINGKPYKVRYRTSEFKGTSWYEFKTDSGGWLYSRTIEDISAKIAKKEEI